MVGMIFVRKIIHLATKIFGSTYFNHILAGLFISHELVVDTQVVLLFVLLLKLMGDVVLCVPWLLPVKMPMVSPFFLE